MLRVLPRRSCLSGLVITLAMLAFSAPSAEAAHFGALHVYWDGSPAVARSVFSIANAAALRGTQIVMHDSLASVRPSDAPVLLVGVGDESTAGAIKADFEGSVITVLYPTAPSEGGDVEYVVRVRLD